MTFTNYGGALTAVQNNYGAGLTDADKADKAYAYFISDGKPFPAGNEINATEWGA